MHSIYPGLDMEATSVCEVCNNPLAETDYLLCADCSRAFTIVLELLRESKPIIENWLNTHPELTTDDLNRANEVLKWRSKKIGLGKENPEITVAPHP
jgi:hypothetical protein